MQPVTRTLWSGRTLEVHPPGTTTGELVLLRALQAWGVGGAVAAMGVVVALHDRPVVGAVVAVVLYAAGFAVLARMTRRTRPAVRTVTVTVFHGNGHPEVHGDVRLLETSLDLLCLAETAVRRGQLSRVEYELVWGRVWSAMPAGASRRHDRPRPTGARRASRPW